MELRLGNCSADENGELLLWSSVKKFALIVFDIGAREDDYYISSDCKHIQFHLFEPFPPFCEKLKTKLGGHLANVHINQVGISQEDKKLAYFPKAESFVNRWNEQICTLLPVIRLDNYMRQNNISHIDFLKIDTEGFELDVLLSLGDKLPSVTHIQFEYGGTYPDRGITLGHVYNLLKNYTIYIISSDGLYLRPYPIEHKQYSNYLATLCPEAIRELVRADV